jgi:hypothetical protein
MSLAAIGASLEQPARAGEASRMRLSREFRLFCLALHPPRDSGAVMALRQSLADVSDWDCIIEGTRRHRVAALLLGGLQAADPDGLPADVIATLRAEALAGATRSLAQTREIGRLARLFAQSGIRVMALKGVVLSAQLYGDAARRDPRDIDLLVEPDRFVDAEALLVAIGYRPESASLSPRQAAAYRRFV